MVIMSVSMEILLRKLLCYPRPPQPISRELNEGHVRITTA